MEIDRLEELKTAGNESENPRTSLEWWAANEIGRLRRELAESRIPASALFAEEGMTIVRKLRVAERDINETLLALSRSCPLTSLEIIPDVLTHTTPPDPRGVLVNAKVILRGII